MTKNTFVIRTGYYDIVKDMSDKQAGLLLKAIFNYAADKKTPELTDVEVKMAFRFVKQDLDYDEQRYQARVEHNRKIAKLGGAPKGNKNAVKQPNGLKNNPKEIVGYKTTLNDNDVDVDNDVDNDYKKQLLTAPKRADTTQDRPKKLTELQLFANEVLKNFEPDVKTPDQKSIWYKRNCRCLTDILKFCERNIPLAIKTIDVCLERMEKAGYACGYEAVCRNLPEYMSVAKQKMGVAYAQAR